MEIFINREIPRCGSWDDPVKRAEPDEAKLQFVHYFDFDIMGCRDFEYYEVLIRRFDRHPHQVGRHALVRVRSAQVLVDETVLASAETPCQS